MNPSVTIFNLFLSYHGAILSLVKRRHITAVFQVESLTNESKPNVSSIYFDTHTITHTQKIILTKSDFIFLSLLGITLLFIYPLEMIIFTRILKIIYRNRKRNVSHNLLHELTY